MLKNRLPSTTTTFSKTIINGLMAKKVKKSTEIQLVILKTFITVFLLILVDPSSHSKKAEKMVFLKLR